MDVNAGAKRFEGRQEKSTAILLAIIVVFVSCHFLRFLVQIYIVFSSPLHGSQKLFEVRYLHTFLQRPFPTAFGAFFQHCSKFRQLHVPPLFLIFGNINHLLLIVNSSVNMVIYICLGRRFRRHLRSLATNNCGCAFPYLNRISSFLSRPTPIEDECDELSCPLTAEKQRLDYASLQSTIIYTVWISENLTLKLISTLCHLGCCVLFQQLFFSFQKFTAPTFIDFQQ